MSGYRKYIVQRKMPIGRHERIFAIDGDYIHVSGHVAWSLFTRLHSTAIPDHAYGQQGIL